MAVQSVPPGIADTVPAEPIYTLHGSEQPLEFSRATQAALEAIRSVEAQDEGLRYDHAHDMAEHMHLALRGSLGGGLTIEQNAVIATLCQVVAFYSQVGKPDYDHWAPFGDVWLGANGEIPPEGTAFFEIDGTPYSVEPNLHTLEWHGNEARTSCRVDMIRGRATPITRRRFDVLRWGLEKARGAAKCDQVASGAPWEASAGAAL